MESNDYTIREIVEKYILPQCPRGSKNVFKNIYNFLRHFKFIRKIPKVDANRTFSKYMYTVSSIQNEIEVIGLYLFNPKNEKSQKYFKAVEDFWMKSESTDSKFFVHVNERIQFDKICGFLLFDFCPNPLDVYLSKCSKHTHARESKKTSIRWIKSVFEALDIIHQRKFIHRNIRPSKLFIENDIIKVIPSIHFRNIDDEKIESLGTGKIPYKAPEMLRGDAYNTSVDIFAAGVVAWQILNYSNEPLVRYKTYDDFVYEINIKCQELKASNDSLENIIGTCIEIDPLDRPSAHSIVEQLEVELLSFGQYVFEQPEEEFIVFYDEDLTY